VIDPEDEGSTVEPLAADARSEGDGRRDARLKLISGLLDLDYDELRQREAGRRLKRMTVAAASAGAIAIVLAVLSVVALTASYRAEREANKAQAVSGYLQDMLTQADPARNQGQELTVRQLLDRVNQELPESVAAEPEVALSIRRTVANTFVGVGDFERGGEELEETLAFAYQTFGEDSTEALETFLDVMRLERRMGRANEALPRLEGRFAAFEAHDEVALRAAALQVRGEMTLDLGRTEEARSYLEQSLALHGSLDESEHWELRLGTLVSMGTLLRRLGDLDQAERIHRESLALLERYGGAPSAAQRASIQNNLGLVLRDKGDVDAAIEMLRESLATRIRLNGEDHPDAAIVMSNLGNLLRQQGQLQEALEILERSLAAHQAIYEDDYPGTAITMGNLASVLIELDLAEADDAIRLGVESLAMFERIYGFDHPAPNVAALTLCSILNDAGAHIRAQQHCEQAASGLATQLGEDHEWVALAHLNSAISAIQLDDLSLAERRLTAAEDVLQSDDEEGVENGALYNHVRGRLAYAAERWDEASQWFEREAALRESLKPDHFHLGRALIWQARSLSASGDNGHETALRAREFLRRHVGEEHFLTRQAERELQDRRQSTPLSVREGTQR
jgi:tetratricopeptide (TPR) repeat protein